MADYQLEEMLCSVCEYCGRVGFAEHEKDCESLQPETEERDEI